jgi:hypothetical protein
VHAWPSTTAGLIELHRLHCNGTLDVDDVAFFSVSTGDCHGVGTA